MARPDATQVARYGYDPRSRRYRDRGSGQYVAGRDVRAAVDAVIDAQSASMRQLAQRLVNGEIALADWQVQSAALLKSLHVAMGLAANGGLAATSASDLGYLANKIKEQYKYLNRFAQEIRSGVQKLDGTLISRAEMYTQAGRGVYENVVGRAAEDAGATEERSVLGPADHCSSCVSQAAKGWQPINSLIPIGQRKCLANCRCTMEQR